MANTPSDESISAKPPTHFAPSERATAEALRDAIDTVSGSPVMAGVLRSLGGILMVLNHQRQIIAVNDELLRFLGCEDPERALGLRPGEALQCVHAQDCLPGGCGTSRFCSTCGAAVAIVGSQETRAPVEAECLLTARVDDHDESFEFRVRASPIDLRGEALTVIALQDIRDQKRKEALESIFFHDILNTAGAVRSAARLLAVCDDKDRDDVLQSVADLCERLIGEIAAQRELMQLESGRFEVRKRYVSMGEIRDLTERFFAGQPVAAGKTLTVGDGCGDGVLFTDPVLLGRVLANMITNALEAAPEGGEVRLSWDLGDEKIVFSVWNAGAIAPEVALRIFQRYFTTKEQRGRGLGTYGMRLIGERCLGGRVSFTSTEADGTTFRIELPREEPDRP